MIVGAPGASGENATFVPCKLVDTVPPPPVTVVAMAAPAEHTENPTAATGSFNGAGSAPDAIRVHDAC